MGESSLLADAIRLHAEANDNNELLMLVEFYAPTHERGVIVKAVPGNDRFEDSSVWISLGDGTYRHLSGEKGLIAKWSRLRGYVKPVYDTKNNVYFV